MNWVTARATIIATSIIAAALLFGLLSSFGITASTNILSTQFTYGQLCGIASAFTAIMFIGRYV